METGAVWELVTPGGTLVFDPWGLESKLALTRIEGMSGAEMRPNVENLPQGDGAIVFAAFRGARYPILEGYVKTFQDLSARRQVLDQIVAYTDTIRKADGTLRYTPTGAAMRECTVRLYDRVQVSSGEGVLKEFQIALVAADPRVYASAQKSVNALLNSGTDTATSGQRKVDVSCGNAGSTPTPPVIRVDGPITDPIVASGPSVLSFPGLTVAAGHYAYIDNGRELIVLDSTTNSLIGYLDIANSDFFMLPVGTTAVSLLGKSYTTATKITVTWRDAFV